MSDYKYTDHNGDRLCIGSGVTDGTVWIQINHGYTDWVEEVKNEDAPAVALAILEAAGITEMRAEDRTAIISPNPEVHARAAVTALTRWQDKRAEQSEREAEDAKVREWWDNTRYGHTTSLCWGHMGESAHEDVRKQYRLARDFFTSDTNWDAVNATIHGGD